MGNRILSVTILFVLGLACFLSASSFIGSIGITQWNAPSSPNEWGVTTSRKPTLIIHAGPTKTGTTTVQCGLITLSGRLATKDNYYYIGKNPFQCRENPMPNKERSLESFALAGRLGTKTGHGNSKLPRNMPEMANLDVVKQNAEVMHALKKHHRNGRNVILSDERFQFRPPDVELLNFLQEKWEIKIIITYRRYFETLVSYYNQTRKQDSHLWQKKRDPLVVFLRKHLFSKIGRFNEERRLYNKSVEAISSSNVIIFNFYQKGNMVENFICDALPGATNTCTSIRNLNKESNEPPLNKNTRQEVDGHILANAVFTFGYFRGSDAGKLTVSKQIEKKLATMYSKDNPAPLLCLTENELTKLLALSMILEELMVPDFYKFRKDEHAEDFTESSKNGDFCELDVDKILMDMEWINFFKSLAKEAKNE